MERKRRQPTPGFKMPPPFNPVTGEHAPTGAPKSPFRVAMMQVIEADTHADYLVCRGYDTDISRFLASVNVAKPLHERGIYIRTEGEILVAVKPKTRIGTTPGKGETSVAQPPDIDETIEILKDDDDKIIWWMALVDLPLIAFELTEALGAGGTADAKFKDAPQDEIIVRDVLTLGAMDNGDEGWAQRTNEESGGKRIFDVVAANVTGGANIVAAKVNDVDHVPENQSPFSVDNIVAVVGNSAGAGTAINTNSEFFFDNADVLLIWDETSSHWDVLLNGSAKHIGGLVDDADHVAESDSDVILNGLIGLDGDCGVSTITAYNTDGEFFFDDATVTVVRNKVNRRWEVVENNTATLLTAIVKEAGDVTLVDADFQVDGTEGMDGHCSLAEEDELTVVNTYLDFFWDNAPVLIIRNREDEQWDVVVNSSAKLLTALTKARVADSAASFDVDGVVGQDGWLAVATDELSGVKNLHHLQMADNAEVYLFAQDDGDVVCIEGRLEARHLECTATSDVDSDDDTFAVENIKAMDGQWSGSINNVDNTLYNNHHFSGSPLELVWNDTDSCWQVTYDGSAKHLTCVVKDATHVNSGDDTFLVDAVVGMDGYCPLGPTDELTVDNILLNNHHFDGSPLILTRHEDIGGVAADRCWIVTYDGSAKHLTCQVDESGHVDSDDDTFEVDTVIGMDGHCGLATATELTVDNTLLNNHHFNNAPLIITINETTNKWRVCYDGSAKNLHVLANETVADGTDINIYTFVGIDGFVTAGISGVGVNLFNMNVDEGDPVWIVVKHDGTYQVTQAMCP